MVSHLLEINVEVTILTRDPKKSAGHFPTVVRILEADYSSPEKLSCLLKGHDSVIILINRDQVDAQIAAIDAAIAAGVPHIIPSSFGLDNTIPEVRDSIPIAGKRRMEEYLAHQAEQGKVSFTALNTSMFLDWAVAAGVLANPRGLTMVFDGGDKPLSATTLDDIGKAVAKIIQIRDQVRNRFLFVHSAVVTQNQLLGYLKELKPDGQFATVQLKTEELEERALRAIEEGTATLRDIHGLMARVSFGLGHGRFGHVDNELLGIPEHSEEQVKQTVARFV